MDIIVPKIQSKYITAFKNESSYDAAYPTFEEVNWSAIKPAVGPEELPDEYRLSRRLSHMYANGTPPDYKFSSVDEYVPYDAQTEEEKTYADAHQIAHHNTEGCPANQMTPDDIRKTFFLEIVWGYSGWEWHDYERVIGTDPETEEPITETLTGGNLYKIKDITTVPHIIDGDRLQHINDFLFSQYNVTRVEGFNTENLVAANRAFKRGTNFDTSYPKRHISEVVPMVLTDAVDTDNNLLDYYFGYADEANNYYTLPKLVEADGLFYNNYVFVKDEPFNAEPIVIPNIKSIDRLYAYGFFTEDLKFKFNKLEKLTRPFMEACFYHSPLNLNDVFIGDTLKKVDDFSYMLGGASFIGWIEGTNHNMEISLDLTSSTVNVDDVINLSHFVEWAGTKENGNDYSVTSDSGISVDLNFNNKVNLDYAFSYLIGIKPYGTYYGDDTHYDHRVGSFERMSLNFNSKENYITSIVGGLKNNTFTETLPIIQVPNNTCDDSYIYQSCIFNVPISYNFLNGSIVSPREQGYGQFNDCTINDSYAFSNIQGLDRVEFCGIKFGNNVAAADRAFPYVVQNQNDTTYRYFDMCNSKFVGTLPSQNIYIDSARFVLESIKPSPDIGGRRINPFYRCSELTDLSNVHLYYSDIDAREEYPDGITRETQFNMDFTGCTNITKSPYIHFLLYRTWNLYFNMSFQNLKNLTEVNFEDFNFRGIPFGTISFQDCTNLVYLKIGTNHPDIGFTAGRAYGDGGFDIRGCANLDIPTLYDTLMCVKNGKVVLLESTWLAVNNNDGINGPVVSYYKANDIDYRVVADSSYVPGSPIPA